MKHQFKVESMSPDQRRHEIATILAEGVLRNYRSAKLGMSPVQKSYPQPQNPLEVSRESRLHVGDGSAG